MNIRIAGIVNESIVDGPGIRMTVFAQGCERGCPGCHNPETQALGGGREISVAEIIDAAKKNPLLRGLTFSGGEPFLQAGAFAELARLAHEAGLDIMTYTGYTIEEILEIGRIESGSEGGSEGGGTSRSEGGSEGGGTGRSEGGGTGGGADKKAGSGVGGGLAGGTNGGAPYNSPGSFLELLRQTDILKDGPYIEARRTLSLPFRGSDNQRVIDVKKYLNKGGKGISPP